VSGCTTWELIAEFGVLKSEWLKKFFPYENGIPSHDTLGRFFAIVNYVEFEKCFSDFTQTLATSPSRLINIDGKTIRGAASNNCDHLLHIVTAYCEQNRLCLGQQIVDDKSNEIDAIPKLLDCLFLEGTIITIDAMGCQKKIAEKIVDKKADYILQVKDNQQDTKEQIDKLFTMNAVKLSHTGDDFGHGRIERRTCEIITDLTFFDDKSEWKNINSVIKISSKVIDKKTGKETKSERLYISSAKETAEEFNALIRGHWAIENNLHWCLDVIFKEDNALKRMGNSSQNFNLVSKTALAMLDAEKTFKKSKPMKRFKAAVSDEYRELIMKV
jgi:predicted transposase YbfD/YdcC